MSKRIALKYVCEAASRSHPNHQRHSQCCIKHERHYQRYANILLTARHHYLDPSPPRVSGLIGAELLTLPLLLPAVEPSSALRSRNPVQRSASDSLVGGGSLKNSVDSAGVLGVRWNGDKGNRKVLFDVPGLARPACSFCSSVQLRSAAINCRI